MWPWQLCKRSCCPVGTTRRRCVATGRATRQGCACSPPRTAEILWRISTISCRFVRHSLPSGTILHCSLMHTHTKLKTMKFGPFLPTCVILTTTLLLTSYSTALPYLRSLLVCSNMVKLSSIIYLEWHGPGYMSYTERDSKYLGGGTSFPRLISKTTKPWLICENNNLAQCRKRQWKILY